MSIKRFAFLLIAVSAFGQGSRKDDIALKASGAFPVFIPSASVRVCNSGSTGTPCTPTATLYSDATLGSTVGNPITADAQGNYHFYAKPGRYDIQITDPVSGGVLTQKDVILAPDVNANNSFTGSNTFKNLESDHFVDAWGAKGDGVTDDTAAINNAITDAASTCARVVFPPPSVKYLISSSINWKPCVNLIGTGSYPLIYAPGNFASIALSSIPTPTVNTALTSVAADGQTWLVGSSTGFVVGKIYMFAGSVNSAYMHVISIPDGTHLKTAEIIPFTLTSPNKVLGPATEWNAKVSGLSFNKNSAGSSSGPDIFAQATLGTNAIINLTVEDNIFTAGSWGVQMSGLGHCRLAFNKFNGSGDGFLGYDLSHCTEEGNRFRWFTQGLRNPYPWDVKIISNDLAFGASQNFTVGIEIAGSNGTTATDKCVDNLIQGNTVYAANQGIPGSGIGGIHLNFNCHHNKIVANTSNGNNIGIYLENSNTYNTFVSNHTNYNVGTVANGGYGAGVYVDGTITTASSFNTWVNHESRFNSTVTSTEGYGSGFMQISPNGSTGHIVGERILGGMFDSNGTCGIYIKGRQNIIDGVAAQGNGGGSSATVRGELCFSSDDMTKINNTISNSHFVSTNSVPQTVYLSNASSLKFVNNLIVNTASQTNALLAVQSVAGTSNLFFTGNSCQCLQSQRGWYFQGVTGQHLSNVYFNNNPDLNQGANGFAVYEFDYTDSFSRIGNKLSGANSQVTLFNTTAEQSQGIAVFDQLTVNGATSGAAVYGATATGGNHTLSGAISSYNGLTTAGEGVPVITGSTSQKSESAADTNVLTITTPAAGSYRVRFVMSVSAANAATLGWTATWTDSSANAQTPTNLSLHQSGTAAPALTFTTSVAGDYYGEALIDTNGAANVVIKLTFAGTSFTAKASATLERII